MSPQGGFGQGGQQQSAGPQGPGAGSGAGLPPSAGPGVAQQLDVKAQQDFMGYMLTIAQWEKAYPAASQQFDAMRSAVADGLASVLKASSNTGNSALPSGMGA